MYRARCTSNQLRPHRAAWAVGTGRRRRAAAARARRGGGTGARRRAAAATPQHARAARGADGQPQLGSGVSRRPSVPDDPLDAALSGVLLSSRRRRCDGEAERRRLRGWQGHRVSPRYAEP